MDTFVRQFVMEMFLETDSVSTMNRVAVAASDVINENNGNISKFTEVLEEFPYMIKDGESKDAGDTPMVNRKQMYYEETIMNYNDEEYYQRFGMKNSTVQVRLIDQIILPYCISHGNFSGFHLPCQVSQL